MENAEKHSAKSQRLFITRESILERNHTSVMSVGKHSVGALILLNTRKYTLKESVINDLHGEDITNGFFFFPQVRSCHQKKGMTKVNALVDTSISWNIREMRSQ